MSEWCPQHVYSYVQSKPVYRKKGCLLPLFSIRFSFFTQKVASTQMGEAKLFDNVGTLSALATAWATCAKKFRSCLW